MFRALYVDNPGFQIGDIDLVTDRNNIRKLLRFVQGSSSDSFQIRVEIAGNRTALFTRVEAKTTDLIQGFRVYGRNFEKSYTQTEGGSSAHHRIVSYDFGGMKCMVRHETDAYVDSKSPTELADSLSDALKGLSLSKLDTFGNNPAATMVETGGRAVDASSTLEIKTRAASRKIDMTEVFPQLWISQTPKLVVGYHRNGVFDNVQLRDMTDEIRRWEVANQKDLGKLACLLVKIIEIVKRSGDRSAVLNYSGGMRLEILYGDGKRALPEDLYAKWKIGTAQAGRGDVAKLSKGDESEATSGRQHPEEDTTLLLIPDGTPFSDLIECSMRKGLRQFFGRMPTQLYDCRTLCKSLKCLPIDVLGGRNLQGIMGDMRSGKSEWDPDERRNIEGLKSLARDSAFRLLYLFLVDEGEARDQNSAYNATLFVVSHRRIFKYRTRKMVREAFEDRFNVSYKQRQNLNKWAIEEQEEGSDVTTEDERFGISCDFDSDFDSYSD